MKARKFLRQIREGLKEIPMLEERRQRLHDKHFPGALRVKEVNVQESAKFDRRADVAAAVDEADGEIIARLNNLYGDMSYAESVIAKILNSKYRQLLTLYYMTTNDTYEEVGKGQKKITGTALLSWADVASRMDMSENYVRRMHGWALEEFERKSDL